MRDKIYNTKHGRDFAGLLPGSFDSEEVVRLYEDSMEALEEVADEYGENFEYEGLSFGHKQGPVDKERSKARSLEEARSLELQGMELLGNSDNFSEPDGAYFRGDTFEGEFVYRPSNIYRGSKAAGRVTVRITPQGTSEQMETDLEDAVENVLGDEGWNLPFLGD